ncbi:10580_t:CDS:2 [Ambispora gerdemannii]|uniref:Pescadillo homolog n=1 Tax=Ambispora gerdemannii TaxID=144530 RepID=A0A9N8ZYM9_9GLOM|nr:10580_t:CDS:2 [Ambispora gerdemannii]
MGKLKKKGQSGAAINYITRNQALKKLQVTLADFRRICILKGIYPRQPKNKKKANKGSTAPATFYYTKDIQYLLHEPVLKKFREYKIFVRKLSKALGKRQIGVAQNLEKNKPVYTLDHIIKERYPSFIEALRDLDDALCMLFLFSTFPATDKIKNETVDNCRRLSSEFQHYVMHTRSLRKTFLSIKGIYYQAEIKGQTINWIVPYQFSQQVPDDVDFRVMLTFLEFYQTLVGFINYKLFTDINLLYPPKFDKEKDDEAAGLDAYLIESTNISANIFDQSKKPEKTNNDNHDDDGNETDDVKKELTQKKEWEKRLKTLAQKITEIKVQDVKSAAAETQTDDSQTAVINSNKNQLIDDFDEQQSNGKSTSTAENKQVTTTTSTTKMFTYYDIHSASMAESEFQQLFSKCIFYLSREVPRYSLEFVIRAFGGQVSWDPTVGGGSLFDETNEIITHQVCDRPSQKHQFLSRVYIQPQWVYDCVNARKLLTTEPYQPGELLPPHLSPFVEHKEGDYIPAIEDHFDGQEDAMEDEDVKEENEGEDDNDGVKVKESNKIVEKVEDSSSESEEETEEMVLMKELEAEAKGIPFSKYQQKQLKSKSTATSTKPITSGQKTSGQKRTIKEIEAAEEQEVKELGKIMMTKKQKKLYTKIEYGKKKQQRKVANLQQKKRELNATSKNKKR